MKRNGATPERDAIALPSEQRRVTEEAMRLVCQRLRQSGELRALLADLDDRIDAITLRQLRQMNQALYTADGIARLQAWQAAKAELQIVRQRLDDLSRPLPATPQERPPLASDERNT